MVEDDGGKDDSSSQFAISNTAGTCLFEMSSSVDTGFNA